MEAEEALRETASRVVAGAIAKQFLAGIQFHAFVSTVGDLKLEQQPYTELDFSEIEKNPLAVPTQKGGRNGSLYPSNS